MSLGLDAFLDEVDPKILEKVTKFDPFANLVFEKFPPFTGGAKSLFPSFPSAETIPVFRKNLIFHLQKTNPNKAFEMKEWEIEGMSLVQTKSQKQYASIWWLFKLITLAGNCWNEFCMDFRSPSKFNHSTIPIFLPGFVHHLHEENTLVVTRIIPPLKRTVSP